MRDTIYRDDAINVLEKLSACKEYGEEIGTEEETYIGKYEAITELSDLPSANEQQVDGATLISAMALGYSYGIKVNRPQGKWVQDPIVGNIMYCSNCKISYTKNFLQRMSLYNEPRDTPHFCPNCGAMMQKGTDNGNK